MEGTDREPAGALGPADPLLSAEASAPVPGTGWTELGLALMVTIWGINFTVVKRALMVFDPLAFNGLRFVFASVFVFVVLRARGQLQAPERRDLPRLLLLGLAGNALYQIAFILGLDRTRAGNASLILALVPVFVLVLGAVGGERHGARAWLGAAVSVLGVALVSGSALRMEGSASLSGDLILVGAALMWTVYTLGARQLIARYGSVQTTAWTLWAGAAGLIAVGAPGLLRQRWDAVGWAGWGGVFFSSFLSIGLAYLIWNRGVERLGGARTAVFSNMTPVVALAVSALWLDERLTPLSVAGAAMVVGGVMLVRD